MKTARKTLCLLAAAILQLVSWPFEIAGHFLPGNSLLTASEAMAETLAGVEEVLKRNFPAADEFREELKRLDEDQMRLIGEQSEVTLDPAKDSRFFFHIAKAGGKTVGYAVEDAVRGKWGLIHYLLALDTEGRVLDVTVLEYRERRGKPVAERRFLKQFVGKDTGSELRLAKDIRGVTGATISSRGVTDGIRKLVHVFRLFYVD
ncbi:MAG: FMN-binding protein [Candidatus Omnitrophica bacterium]|nr:FMN-binding protein [Candidatus Omnitrophota bacterium]